jgi:hypothetical protein
MPEQNAVVAIYNTHTAAEEAVKELQRPERPGGRTGEHWHPPRQQPQV